jgi:collagenase-like protein with putative collagen-binding domain
MRCRSVHCWLVPLLAGCGSTGSEPGRLSAVTITPRGAIIGTSAVVGFRATGSYNDGSSRDLTGIVWQSSVPAVATINRVGIAIGKAAGRTVIRAEVEGFRDSTTLVVSANAASGPLRVSSLNPRYFADPSGRVVYLTGSEYWKTIQDDGPSNPPPAFDNSAFLGFLQSHNHNFTRLYMWEQARWSAETSLSHWFSPTPYMRLGPGTALDGGPKFDVTQINPAYLARVRQRVIDAGARGIYVSVMLFDGWSLGVKGNSTAGNPWLAHPFNAANNINGINGDPNVTGRGAETQTLSIPAVTASQEAYVKAVIDAVNDLDNVIYEISNESDQSADAWQYHMIALIRSYELTKPKQHPIGMTVPYPTVPQGTNSDVLSSTADWVSMNGDVNNPVVADGSKVSLSDTDHLCGICGDAAWPWRSLTRGHNPLLMDGYDGSPGVGDPIYNPSNPIWEMIRTNMGYARSYALRMDLAHALPSVTLASSGYCLAVAGSEYLVFLPSGGSVSVDLTSVSGSRSVEWFNPGTGLTTAGAAVTGGSTVTLTAPFSGMAVVYIHP